MIQMGKTVCIADAHRGDGRRLVVRADEKLTAFVSFCRCSGVPLRPTLVIRRWLAWF
jgi:hypothetical protein